MKYWGAKQSLSPAHQYLFLNSNPISKGAGSFQNTGLIWRFSARPTFLSRSYNIRLEYSKFGTIDVFVESPDIQALAGCRSLPHVYNDPLRLCLYMPNTGQWQPSKRLDKSIVPWTFTWLFFFEEWLISDDWKGGGKHPDENVTS